MSAGVEGLVKLSEGVDGIDNSFYWCGWDCSNLLVGQTVWNSGWDLVKISVGVGGIGKLYAGVGGFGQNIW